MEKQNIGSAPASIQDIINQYSYGDNLDHFDVESFTDAVNNGYVQMTPQQAKDLGAWLNSATTDRGDIGDAMSAVSAATPQAVAASPLEYGSGLNVEYDANGRPKLLNPDAIPQVASQYSQKLAGLSSDNPWTKMAYEQQKQDEAKQMGQVTSQAQASGANADAVMAGRGGLSSGQRMSIARNTANQTLAGQQGVAQQGAANRLNIGMQGYQQNVGNLGTWAALAQKDVGNQLGLAQNNLGMANSVWGTGQAIPQYKQLYS